MNYIKSTLTMGKWIPYKKRSIIKNKVENITKVKGLSLVTVATVIAETNGFHIIRNQKQFVYVRTGNPPEYHIAIYIC